MKKFPDIYDIQIELEQSKVGQNEMLREILPTFSRLEKFLFFFSPLTDTKLI